MADDLWWEAVALKRYRFHPMMLIGDEPQSYPSYRDIAVLVSAALPGAMRIAEVDVEVSGQRQGPPNPRP